MKFFTLILTMGFVINQLTGATAFDWKFKKTMKEKLIHFLESRMRELMRTGNATFGVPVLDTYQKPEEYFMIDAPQLYVDGVLYNFAVQGLSEYEVIDGDIHFFPPKVIFNLNFPKILAEGWYTFNGEAVHTFPLYGEGGFSMVIKGFSLDATVGIGLGSDLIKSLTLNIALDELELDATGLFNDKSVSNMLSLVLSDMIPNFIRDFHDDITAYVEPKVIEIINHQLDGLSWKELIGLIG